MSCIFSSGAFDGDVTNSLTGNDFGCSSNVSQMLSRKALLTCRPRSCSVRICSRASARILRGTSVFTESEWGWVLWMSLCMCGWDNVENRSLRNSFALGNALFIWANLAPIWVALVSLLIMMLMMPLFGTFLISFFPLSAVVMVRMWMFFLRSCTVSYTHLTLPTILRV